MPLIFLTVKLPDGAMVHTDIDPKTRVEEFKAIIAPKVGIKKHKQRLVYAGRLMTDGKTLESYNLESRCTVHVLHASTAESGPEGVDITAVPPQLEALQRHVLQNQDILGQMLESPAMQSLLNDQDLLRSLLKMDPRLSKLFSSSPELEQMLYEPEFMQQTAEQLRNPVLVRDNLKSTERAMEDVKELKKGGAFDALRVMCEDIQRPQQDEGFEANPLGAVSKSKSARGASVGSTLNSDSRGGTIEEGDEDAEPDNEPSVPEVPMRDAPDWTGTFDCNAMASMIEDQNMQQLLAQLVHTMGGPGTRVHPDDPFIDAGFLGQMFHAQTLQSMASLEDSIAKLSRAFDAGEAKSAPAKDPKLKKSKTSGLEAGPPADSPAALSTLHHTSPAANFKESFALYLAAAQASPEVRFKGQLQAMSNMGFDDKDACIQALHSCDGNVGKASEMLMQSKGHR